VLYLEVGQRDYRVWHVLTETRTREGDGRCSSRLKSVCGWRELRIVLADSSVCLACERLDNWTIAGAYGKGQRNVANQFTAVYEKLVGVTGVPSRGNPTQCSHRRVLSQLRAPGGEPQRTWEAIPNLDGEEFRYHKTPGGKKWSLRGPR